MGNCIGVHDNNRSSELGLLGSEDATHEGIKTVEIDGGCKFSATSVLCVCIVTWNMNGKVPSDDFTELVGRDRKCELLVVGLQEVPKKINIAEMLQEALKETHSLLGQSDLQSLKLLLFGGKSSEANVKEISLDKHAVGGCGGLIGRKKGAVAIYIDFNGIRMVFIACHLSAHKHKVEERNSQCRHISHSLFFKDHNAHAPIHVTVWLGDLNYRLDGIETFPARNLIHEDLHEQLTSRDQLLHEAERGEVFKGYCEGTLSFKPTYKYNVGSNSYDTSYKIRVPSWTDRILFKVDNDSGIDAVLSSYEAIESIKSSDHKPVKAHLCLKVQHTDN